MSNNFRTARTAAGFSRQELAARTGISLSSVISWELGRRRPTDAYLLRRVAQVLGCRIEDLLEPEPDAPER